MDVEVPTGWEEDSGIDVDKVTTGLEEDSGINVEVEVTTG
jgi:hypothetical protein